MIVSMLRFGLKQGMVPSLERTFAKHRILETAIQVEGCRSLVLAAPDAQGETAYVIGLWDDEAAYQRWISHPDRGAATEDLLQLVAGEFDPTAPAEEWQVLRAIQDADQSSSAAGSPGTRERNTSEV